MFAQTKQEQEYELKNLLLGFASDWYVEKDTLEKAKATLPHLSDFYNGVTDSLDDLPLQSIIEEPLKDVYTVPLFSKELCNLLVNEMHNMTDYFGWRSWFSAKRDNVRVALRGVNLESKAVFFFCGLHVVRTVGTCPQ